MHSNSPQLPEPPTAGTSRYQGLLSKYWLDYSRNYPEPHYLFRYNGVDFSPLGGLQAITGQQKNGKSFFLTMLMAAALEPSSERVRSYLRGLELSQETLAFIGRKPRVLYIDTEMEDLNTVKVARRVQWLCEWPLDEQNERFRVLWLRAVDDEEDTKRERWELTKAAIEDFQPNLVILDGIVDIVHNFNDNDESSRVIGEIMTLATKRNICIWTALHQNPGNDAMAKMRGHLGTELANKSSDTFVSVKEKKKHNVKFTVKQINARNKDVDDFSYEVTADAGRLGVPRILDNDSQAARDYAQEQEDDRTMKALNWPAKGLSFTEISRQLAAKYRITSQREIYKILDRVLISKILIKTDGKYGRYFYRGIADADDPEQAQLPFGKPSDDEQAPY